MLVREGKLGIVAVAAQPMPGTSWYTIRITASQPEWAHEAQLGSEVALTCKEHNCHGKSKRDACSTRCLDNEESACHPLSAPSWCQGGRPAAGRWIAGLFQQLRVPVQRGERLREHGVPRSLRGSLRKRPGGSRMASEGESINLQVSPSRGNTQGKGKWEGRSPLWGKYPSLLPLAPQLSQLISLENAVPLFSSAVLWRKASGRISSPFLAGVITNLFSERVWERRGILLRAAFWGNERQQGQKLRVQLSEGGSTYFTSCKNLCRSSSYKACLCLAESAPDLERRRRNKYRKCWGSAEARVSYVGFIENKTSW